MLLSVGLEHAPTMMVVYSMSVTVEMELRPVELETLSLVLVSLPITHIGIGNTMVLRYK